MKHSIMIVAHNSLGLLIKYLPHNIALLEGDQEILFLDLCSQDGTIDYLLKEMPELKDAMALGKLRMFKCAGNIQVTPAQGFNALSKHAKGSIYTFMTANQFVPAMSIYDRVFKGQGASPTFATNAQVGGVKISLTAQDFIERNGFYEGYHTFEFLMSDGLRIPCYRYVDVRPPLTELPRSLGNINSDVATYFSLKSAEVPTINKREMGTSKIIEVGVD